MDAIRFEPSISADFALDRRQAGRNSDAFSDMLGDQLKKRAEPERPEPVTRRRPTLVRHDDADDGTAPIQRTRKIISHAHQRDVSDGAAPKVVDSQPTDGRPVDRQPIDGACGHPQTPTQCMDDQSDAAPDPANSDADDEDQQSEQQAPVVISIQAAPDAIAKTPEVDAAVVIAAAPAQPVVPQAAEPIADVQDAVLSIAPIATSPAELPAAPSAEPADGAPAQAAEAENAAATFAAALDNTMAATIADRPAGETLTAETMAGGNAAGGLRTLAAADLSSLTTLAVTDRAVAAAADSSAESANLTIKITPDAPRPANEGKPRPSTSTHAAPVADVKGQPTNTQMPQPQAVPQAAASTAAGAEGPETALLGDGFGSDGVATSGWALHLAPGAAGKRPDFIAQLRQHLQDLPAHEQVAVNIQRAIREGTGRLSIQLSPVELGQIHIKLDIDEDKRVTATVVVEKPSTLELLQRDAKGLERALHDAGLKMDGNDLSFSLGRQDGKEFAQDMKQPGSGQYGGEQGKTQAENEVPAEMASIEIDTAAGLVNVQI